MVSTSRQPLAVWVLPLIHSPTQWASDSSLNVKKSASVIPSCQVPWSNHLIPAAETRFFSHPESQGQTSFLEFSSHFPFTHLSQHHAEHQLFSPPKLITFSSEKYQFTEVEVFHREERNPIIGYFYLKKMFWKKKIILTFQIDRFWLCASKLFPSQTYAK